MSKGMWTKHCTADDKVFYFNAEQNKSLWVPPPDSVIHEATTIIPIDATQNIISMDMPTSSTINDSMNKKAAILATTTIPNEISTNSSLPIEPIILSDADLFLQETFKNIQSNANQNTHIHSSGNKRFKSNSTSNYNNNDNTNSEYQRLVNEIQESTGTKGNEGGKWLVR